MAYRIPLLESNYDDAEHLRARDVIDPFDAVAAAVEDYGVAR